MRTAVVLLFLFVLNVFADEQTSLYQRALEAESSGDIVDAITLFEDALFTEGPYTEEILQILKEYYAVLGIDFLDIQKQNLWRFGFDFDAIGVRYEEKESEESSKEWLGEGFSVFSIAYDIYRNQRKHSIEFSFLSEVFLKSDSSSLDTNDWVISPAIEYSLMSKSFALATGANFTLSEGDKINPAFFFLFEKYAFKRDTRLFVLEGFAFINKILEMRSGLNLSWHQNQKKGLSMSASLGLLFNVDSTASILLITDDNYLDGIDSPYLDVSYYQGVKWGPAIQLKSSYQFDNPIGIEMKGSLAPTFLINEKDSLSVSFLEGGLGGCLFAKWDQVQIHAGIEHFIRYYTERPELWKGIIPETMLFTEFKMGTKINF